MIIGSKQDTAQHKGNLHSLDIDNVWLINLKLFTISESNLHRGEVHTRLTRRGMDGSIVVL